MKRLNLFLAAALVTVMLLSLLAGRHWIAPGEWLAGDLRSLIITELRLPRICLGVLVGAGLGMSGAAMQGYLRNPLADPGLFGISACAALGAVTSIFFGLARVPMALPSCALIGAGVGAGVLMLLAGRSGSLILFTLAGVMLSSLAGALTALVINLAPTPFASAEIITWLMGALTDRGWADVGIALILLIPGMALLMRAAASLDMLSLGDVVARSMGVNMACLQRLLVVGLALCVGGTVAVAGVIGFVGLMVPHLMRPLVGHRPSALLAPSALAGALLVVVADTAVRVAPVVSEIRLGVMMSVLGGPFFLMLLMKLRREIA
ncbi:MAG: iron ABC transporter permease [Sphingobium sp.]|nr:iron ABC transporter permease [Sphingobium sp.]MBP6111847.1 iron ABC transporter permease [Sphingobium sp.]MBP8669789.1 iron ABC transporter permease [Sphingobium sp.]MBP9156451.1 iron ABC transporter permease [Sphingobium sp.]MCC6482750.1 iron ABC transporter permease [Sphingomonadaceae bacterium]